VKDIYVGSTVDFDTRKNQHKGRCHRVNGEHYHLKVYTFIRAHGGWKNWKAEIIVKFPCESKKEKHLREKELYEELIEFATLNSQHPGRSDKEWSKEYYENNREKISEKGKVYYAKNIEKMRKKGNDYYKNNRESMNKKHREWRENNVEKVKETSKKYRERNKEKIRLTQREYRKNNKEKLKKKVQCDCGSIVRKVDLPRHRASQKHKQYILSFNNPDLDLEDSFSV